MVGVNPRHGVAVPFVPGGGREWMWWRIAMMTMTDHDHDHDHKMNSKLLGGQRILLYTALAEM